MEKLANYIEEQEVTIKKHVEGECYGEEIEYSHETYNELEKLEVIDDEDDEVEVDEVEHTEHTEHVEGNNDIAIIDEEEDISILDNKQHKLNGPDFRKKETKEEENKAVMKFQRSGDLKILEQIYLNRVPTLNYWARKNRHLDNNSINDIKSELIRIFLKAVKQYKAKRITKGKGKIKSKTAKTDFNTYLYTSFNYALCNIYNRRKAKKRTSFASEHNKLANMLLSLDYVYGHTEDGGFTLKDIMHDENADNASDRMQINEILNILSQNCPSCTKDFLRQVSEGRTVSALIKEYKLREGKIKASSKIIKQINNSRRPCTKIVTTMLKETISEKFRLTKFYTKGAYIHYTIEMHKTDETDAILSRIRKLKKNKDFYLDKIKVL